jgi:hypothetical protein
MARLEISSINPVGREQRIDTNFAELYATTGADDVVWASANITATASAGAYTTATGAAWYKQIGKTVHIQLTLGVTTVGTGTGGMTITLPVTPKTTFKQALAVTYEGTVGAGVASGLTCYTNTTGATARVFTYDGGNVGADGTIIYVGGTYEAT